MFTGIVTSVGRVASAQAHGGGCRLAIDAGGLPGDGFVLGESIAVAGVCLTVTGFSGALFDCDVSGETLRLTTLARLAAGSAVNLERALRAGDRLGGHLVSGHVDGVGSLRGTDEDGLSRIYRFEVPEPLRRYLAVKGSVAVDGVSLTVNAVDAVGFSVNLIPHTLVHSTLGALETGAPVNIEVDQIARYAERLLGFIQGGHP